MFLSPAERIKQLENRVSILRNRGEEMNRALINKALRQIRKLQKDN